MQVCTFHFPAFLYGRQAYKIDFRNKIGVRFLDFQSGLILYAFDQGNGLFFLLAGGRKNYRRNKPKRQHRLVFP